MPAFLPRRRWWKIWASVNFPRRSRGNEGSIEYMTIMPPCLKYFWSLSSFRKMQIWINNTCPYRCLSTSVTVPIHAILPTRILAHLLHSAYSLSEPNFGVEVLPYFYWRIVDSRSWRSISEGFWCRNLKADQPMSSFRLPGHLRDYHQRLGRRRWW